MFTSLLVVHIVAGALALLSGYVALYAVKGGTVHRRIGMLFVYAMLTMCAGGFIIAVGWEGWSRGAVINVPASLLTAYLVITSLTTVRPVSDAARGRALAIAAMLIAFGVGVGATTLGFVAIGNKSRTANVPAFPFFLFGFVGLLAFAGDVRLLRAGVALRGVPRLTRHLWRMTFALWIATMSFFLGQAKVIPKPIRIPALLATPVIVVLLVLLYWLWRVRRLGCDRDRQHRRQPAVGAAGNAGEFQRGAIGEHHVAR
jgi:uncharacterized membrane protein